MYYIQYVQYDAFRTIETINKVKANAEYRELYYDSTVTELKAYVLTIDVKFASNGKVYTYLLDTPLHGYRFVKTPNGDLIQIVNIKHRTPDELKAMAQSRGFSYSDYKVLHGTAIK